MKTSETMNIIRRIKSLFGKKRTESKEAQWRRNHDIATELVGRYLPYIEGSDNGYDKEICLYTALMCMAKRKDKENQLK